MHSLKPDRHTYHKATSVFLDTEFTSLLDPQLLSIGLVTLDGRECYAELDLATEFGKPRLDATPWDVRENILDKFGLFPEAKCDSEWTMGVLVSGWLFGVASSDPQGRLELLYDYDVDLELLVECLGECNFWPTIRTISTERNIAVETGSIGPELASEATFRAVRRRTPPLYRHHALGDALALRAAWRTSALVQHRSRDFRQLLNAAGLEREGWLYEWLATPAALLAGETPLDVLDQVEGLSKVLAALNEEGSR